MDTEDGLEEFIQELSEEIGVPVIITTQLGARKPTTSVVGT